MKYKSFEQGPRGSPVREGDVRMVKIVDQGKQGDGIARVEGLIIFVKGAKIGEELNVKVTKIIKNSAFAEKVEG
ncbi:MAG TPA: TRAM domain-containing protein [Methanomassiliicoccales archaeon]|nr:TRAM domain-containing protein [Methanomassiliicoccales archaeon]